MQHSRARVCLVACVIAGSLGVAALAPLTLSQLLRLIEIRTPDATVAAEIVERGVRPPIDQKMLETLRKAGAGPATIKALDRIRPRAQVRITGIAGTRIIVNGASAGRIGDGGMLSLNDLWPGQYEFVAELSEHTPEKRVLTLAANGQTDVAMQLRPLYGILSITTTAADATITVEGVSRFRAPLTKHRLRAGSYTVKIESPYRQARIVTLEIPGGEVVEQQFTLEPDHHALEGLLVRIRQNFSNRNYRATATDAATYVAVADAADTSSRVVALTHLAMSELALRKYSDAISSGMQALAIGGTLSLEVMHHHASGFVEPHRATLTVSKYKFHFDPIAACTVSRGSVDSARVLVTTDSNLRMPKGWSAQAGARAVAVKLPKPNKPTEHITLNFFDEDYQRLSAVRQLLSTAVTLRRNAKADSTISASDAIGRFVRVGGPSDVLELKADGTFILQQQGQSASGTYSLSGNTLTLRTAKQTDTGEFEGPRLIDAQGEIWVKAS